MNDLLSSSLFSSYSKTLSDISEKILTAESIQIVATADLEGVLALAQIEAGLLDAVKSYKRRVLPPKKNISRTEAIDFSAYNGLIIHIDPFHEPLSKIDTEKHIHLTPLHATVNFTNSEREHHGALDCVVICAVIAQQLSRDGLRVRRLRGMAISGSWLRRNLDANYDPIMSFLRDHLDEEGSIEIRPLPEVPDPIVSMIPGLSKGMLSRLSKSWNSMDIDERSSAISELILPTLRHDSLSTMRLEELVWHRVMLPGYVIDLASQLHLSQESWPEESDKARLHASVVTDELITSGHL
jgi:hypothetical protein